ncbi:MAG: flavoprotein [Alphaproteobacteria bacterium]|nr:flavoprotein [Alphaproteobacteria bacterium]
MLGEDQKNRPQRLAWAVTGSGHFFRESLELMARFAPLDLFISKAAAEVVRQYDQDFTSLPKGVRLFKDNSASAVPVGKFYHGEYHSLVLAPATSNTIAKCVVGISDSLPTNLFAQAGKCRVPTIVFACDTAPELLTEAPSEMVTVWPRTIDLVNVERLKEFAGVTVVDSMAQLEQAIASRLTEAANGHGR